MSRRRRRPGWAGLVAATLAAAPQAASPAPAPVLLYIGTQAEGDGHGILLTTLDEATGRFAPAVLAAPIDRPTWLLRDPHRRRLYAVRATGFDGRSEAGVAGYAVARNSGALRPLGLRGSGGGGATHLVLDPRRRTLFIANYAEGRVAALPVGADGGPGAVAAVAQDRGSGPHARQLGPHAHGLALNPADDTLAVADLGADRVFRLRYAPRAQRFAPVMPPLALPSGSGPRHLAFSHDGRFLFVVTELSAQLFVFRWRQASAAPVAVVTLDPPGFSGARSAAEIVIDRQGRTLYVSNRGEDLIHVFTIDQRTGAVAERQRIGSGGTSPWTMALTPDGRWLVVANQRSGELASFAVDPGSGRLAPAAGHLAVDRPVALAFVR